MHLQIYSSMCCIFPIFFVVIKSPDTYFPLDSSSLSMDDKAHVTIQFDALDPALRPERPFVPNENVQQLQIPQQQQQQHPSPPSSSSDHNRSEHHQAVPLVAATSSGGSGGGHLSRSRSRHVRSRSLPQKNPVATLLHNLSSKLHLKPTTAARYSCDDDLVTNRSYPFRATTSEPDIFWFIFPSPPPICLLPPLRGCFFSIPETPTPQLPGTMVHTKEILLRLLIFFSSSLPLVGFPARIMIFDETIWQLKLVSVHLEEEGRRCFAPVSVCRNFYVEFCLLTRIFFFVLFLLLLLLRLV